MLAEALRSHDMASARNWQVFVTYTSRETRLYIEGRLLCDGRLC